MDRSDEITPAEELAARLPPGGARLIDGVRIARAIEAEVAGEAQELKARGASPHLATLQVGQDPAIDLYIRNQKRRFARLGIQFNHISLDAEIDEEGVLSFIRPLNANPTITGIMIALPLPPKLNPIRIQQEIVPEKEVEGVGPFNLGNLIYDRGPVGPCSALAVLEAIRSTGVRLEGARAVVVGHSNIVGKPATLCLMRDLATTTTCNIATRNLAEETRRADILVVAVGKPRLITADMVKPGSVVIDVGINDIPADAAGDPARRQGGEAAGGDAPAARRRIVGDVDFHSVFPKASWITPVPGGIGPITVAMLARNTVALARHQLAARSREKS